MTASWTARVSLRWRILLGMLAILLVALAIFSLATVTLLRSFLLDRVDTRLLDARIPISQVSRTTSDPDARGPFNGGAALDRGPGPRGFGSNSFAFLLFDSEGQPVRVVNSGITGSPDPLPALPPFNYDSAADLPTPFTTEAVGDSSFHYRVLVTRLETHEMVVMALPINTDDETISRLLRVEATIAALVIGAVAIVGLRLVRVGLRPLDDMTETASAIAGGDLSHRVDLPDDQQDEVGRLGHAFNGMLSQIEAAFQKKELSEDQLRQFVADASHELRTPLTSIRGYAELYRRGALPSSEAVGDAMGRIENEAARMSVLVDDLLLLARLDQGRPLEQEPVDLVSVAGEAVRSVGVIDPERPVQFDHDDQVVVVGDPMRLHQVVTNLLDNARFHTPAGTPVQVTVHADDGFARIRVADRGPGLDPEVAARVFERSFRGEGVAKRHAGSGLGLSIVAAIAEAHGGTAAVTSRPGEGTVFTVSVPLTGSDRPLVSAGASF